MGWLLRWCFATTDEARERLCGETSIVMAFLNSTRDGILIHRLETHITNLVINTSSINFLGNNIKSLIVNQHVKLPFLNITVKIMFFQRLSSNRCFNFLLNS